MGTRQLRSSETWTMSQTPTTVVAQCIRKFFTVPPLGLV